MKSIFALSVLLALGASTVASAAPNPVRPWFVCKRLNPDTAKDQCFALVDRFRYFDEYAAGECDRYTDSWLTVTCMQVIAGQSFSRAGVLECDRYKDANQTTQCLQTIAGQYLDDAAVAACARVNDAALTTACLSAIVGKHFHAWEVSRCDGYASAEGTIGCFRNQGW